MVTAMTGPSPTSNDHSVIACQQILEENHSVFSIQWVVVPAAASGELDAPRLLERYLCFIRRCTLSLVRPAMVDSGIEFRLAASPVSLISFDPPLNLTTPDGSRSRLSIRGGMLVQRGECDRGQLEFGVEQCVEGLHISIQLTDFCPLILGSSPPSPWRRWLYRLTQAYLHKVVTVRFLATVHGQLTGRRPRARVVKVVVRQGRDI
jgi:hypothetical protein